MCIRDRRKTAASASWFSPIRRVDSALLGCCDLSYAYTYANTYTRIYSSISIYVLWPLGTALRCPSKLLFLLGLGPIWRKNRHRIDDYLPVYEYSMYDGTYRLLYRINNRREKGALSGIWIDVTTYSR